MSLEQQVTRGYVTCIYPMNRAFHPNELVLELVDDPATGKATRLLEFSGIEDYSEQWDEEAGREELQQLIGSDEYPKGKHTRYVIALDAVEMIFTSAETPVIVEL